MSLPVHTEPSPAPSSAPAASCHSPAVSVGPGPTAAVVALVGAPNVGKSTLFNALTGARVTVGNWPGTTVEVARGRWRTKIGGRTCNCLDCACPDVDVPVDYTLIDLPGAYSLDPLSPDEELTRDLIEADPADHPDLVIAVVDAAHLTRSLYLVSQLRELPLRIVVALSMRDVADRRGIEVDPEALAARLGVPVVPIDPRRRSGLDPLAKAAGRTLARSVPPRRPVAPWSDELEREDERFSYIEAVQRAGTISSGERRATTSDRIDAVVTAPVRGPLVFLAVMWLVFQATTTLAAPLQDALGQLFSGPVTDLARLGLTAAGLSGSWVEGLVVDGLIAGVGMLLTFVPLMAMMFVLLALLEDSGYLARAAVVTDRLMRSIGLPGKAFLPLVVGFGCNVPAISATRILGDVRQRILTALLVPFTSCSARLTVYVMVGTTFFGAWAGTVVFGMYVVSILLVVAVGFALRRTLWRSMGPEPLVLDLPPYQVPTLRLTAAVTWVRLRGFLKTASGIIVGTVCAVWLLQAIPAGSHGGFGEVPVADSVYGLAAQAIAPVFQPAGFAQWQTVSALVVGFVAKEAVISSWAQTYATDLPGDSGGASLGAHILDAFNASSSGHPGPAVLAFLVFLLAYTPCVATLSAQRREIGWRWTGFGAAIQLVVAWVLAVGVFHVGRWFW